METQPVEKKPVRAPKIKIGERVFDLADLPPYTIADRIAVTKLGVDPANLRSNPESEAKFVHYALQKLDPALTYEQVLTLPYGQAIRLVMEYLTKGVELDLPFSTPSPTSDTTTAGPAVTSSPSQQPS